MNGVEQEQEQSQEQSQEQEELPRCNVKLNPSKLKLPKVVVRTAGGSGLCAI